MPGASDAPVAARKPLFRFLAPYALWHPTPFIHPRCSGYEAVNISDGPFSLPPKEAYLRRLTFCPTPLHSVSCIGSGPVVARYRLVCCPTIS